MFLCESVDSLNYACEMNLSISEITAINLAQNTYFRILLGLRMTVTAFAIVLVIVLRCIQGGHFALHSNAKILINNHAIAMILYCSATFIMHGLDLKSFLTFRNADELLLSKLHCILGQVPLIMSWAAINITLCMMAFERTIATIYYKSYEKRTARSGYILVTVQWSIVVVVMVITLTNSHIQEHSPTCYFASANNNFLVSFLFLLMATVEILALVTFYLILHINQLRRKSAVDNGTLTEKYQLDENIRATKIMIPMVITHFVCLFPFMCLSTIYTFYYSSWNVHPDQGYAVFRETFDWTPYYCIILPIVVFWRRKVQREKTRNGLTKLGLNRVEPSELRLDGRTHEQIRHFQLLKEAWDSAEF